LNDRSQNSEVSNQNLEDKIFEKIESHHCTDTNEIQAWIMEQIINESGKAFVSGFEKALEIAIDEIMKSDAPILNNRPMISLTDTIILLNKLKGHK